MCRLLFVLLFLCVTSCATPELQAVSHNTHQPTLHASSAVMADGYELPVTVWKSTAKPTAIALAIHGFNDYRNAFADVAPKLASQGITTYAYDQRGFGETSQRGIWAGREAMLSDARQMALFLCNKHPNLPLYIIGESMGGAVTMNISGDVTCIDGIVLIAPAVWGWDTMPFYQRIALRIAAHVTPGYAPTGEHLDITPSDNRDMLIALGRDPLVIKKSRMDTLYGLTNLMQQALEAGPRLRVPTLLLYGEHDEIIPPRAMCQMLRSLPQPHTHPLRMVLYPDGYHMLTRDLQSATVMEDMLAWLRDQQGALPSRQEVSVHAPRVRLFCKHT